MLLAATAGLAVEAAQLDPGVRDRVLSASVQIAMQVETTEHGQTRPEFVPVGSGTVVSPAGLILTNWHVVDVAALRAQLDLWEEQAERSGDSLVFVLNEDDFLILATEGAQEPKPMFVAEVMAEHHALDLAVLQITTDMFNSPVEPAGLDLPFVPIGDSSSVVQGDPIHVFGYPAIGGGTLQYTSGVVSGFGYQDGIDGPAWITTDASLSGGSSGGTAVDTAGLLIGIPTAGGQLDCRPGDTNGDGTVTPEDVGCIPTGGSLGQLRPIDLAKPMLASVGLEAPLRADESMAVVNPVPTTTSVAPTSTPQPSSTTAPPTSTPVLTSTPDPPSVEPDHDISSQTLPLLDLLPTQAQLPPGLILADEAERSQAEVVASLGGTEEAAQLLDEWGWSGNAFRDFIADPESPPPTGTTFLNVAVHRFVDAPSANNAMVVFSDYVIFNQGLQRQDAPAIGDDAILLVGAPDGIPLAVLYAQEGPILYRIGGSSGAAEADPTSDVLAVAGAILGPAGTSGADESADRLDSGVGSMYRGDDGRSGVMPGPGPGGGIGELWRVETGEAVWSSPVVVEGSLYLGTGDADDSSGFVLALDASTGSERWRFSGGPFLSAPTVHEGVVYAAGADGILYALNASDGTVARRYSPFGVTQCSTGASPVVHDGLVLVSFACYGPEDADNPNLRWSDLSGYLVAFDTGTGSSKWAFRMNGFSPTVSPAVSDGVVVVAASSNAERTEGTVHAVDVNTGDELWRFDANSGFETTSAVSDGLVIAQGYSGQLFALDLATGVELWRFDAGSFAGGAPALSDGRVYVSDGDETVTAIDARSGEVAWRGAPGRLGFGAPVLTSDAVYMGGTGGILYVLDRETGKLADGGRVEVTRPLSAVNTDPWVGDEVIYVVNDHGVVVALGDVRPMIPIGEGMAAEVVRDGAVLRAAPSASAVERATLSAGTRLAVTGQAEQRQGATWWPVTADGIGTGWILESEIVASEVPKTVVPSSTSSSTPSAAAPSGSSTERCQEPGYPQPGEVVETVHNAYLREAPDSGSGHIALLPPGTQLVAAPNSAVRVDLVGTGACDWVAVSQSQTGDRGFVRATGVRIVGAESGPTPTPGNRAAAQMSSPDAEATIAAQATSIARLESEQLESQATATALAVVAANSVLDPNRQSITIQTDLGGILGGDQDALETASEQLSTALSRFPIGCRAGFLLISGNAPDIGQGIDLAERIEALLREFWPDIFTEATGAEQFAQPDVQPFGEVNIDVFFYSGCEPLT
jgi:outer membrane protein assembly factor BamB/S1-C subfamily serine protease